MSEAVRERALDPFYTTKKNGGTGLGLYICHNHALRRALGLHTLDGLHLLAALDLQHREPELRLVTADRALANVADLAGIPALRLSPTVEPS